MPETLTNPAYLTVLALGLITTACQITFSISTSRLRLLLFNFAASIGFLVQYALLAQWVGFWSGVVGTTYTALLALGYRWRALQALPLMIAATISYALVFIALTDWGNFAFAEAIPLVAGVAVLLALRSQNLIVTKAIFIGAGILWLGYELHNGMFTQLLGEGFEMVGNIVTLALLIRASRATRVGLAKAKLESASGLPRDEVDTELIAVLRVGHSEREAQRQAATPSLLCEETLH